MFRTIDHIPDPQIKVDEAYSWKPGRVMTHADIYLVWDFIKQGRDHLYYDEDNWCYYDQLGRIWTREKTLFQFVTWWTARRFGYVKFIDTAATIIFWMTVGYGINTLIF